MSSTARKRAKTDIERQCRACLSKIDGYGFTNIFLPWDQWDTNPTWSVTGLSIAERLTKLTNVEISDTDPYSKLICLKCCNCLKDAYNFIWTVTKSDTILRYKKCKDSKADAPSWPKPIQVDKNIVSHAFENEMHVEVKQEVMTEDENEASQTMEMCEPCEMGLDIKIEPEEMTPAQIETELYDAIHDPESDDSTPQTNGTDYIDEVMLQCMKEEPVSDDETELDTYIGKECMLCMKSFSTFKGLKAHVIAIHSYESVTSPRVERTNVCATCKRSFTTRTDLYVHETCHGKFVCYVCDKKFDTFCLLIKHRSKCKNDSTLPRLKTLEDVRRPVYYIFDKAAASQENPPIKDHNLQSHDEPDKEPINDLQKTNCTNKDNFDNDNKIEGRAQNIEQLEPEINAIAKGNNASRESKHTSMVDTIGKKNPGLKEPTSNIKLKDTSLLKGPYRKIEYTVVFDDDNAIDNESQNIEQSKSESNANAEGTQITKDNTSHNENVEETDTGLNEPTFKSNIKLKNINVLQKSNCFIQDTLDFDGDDKIEQRTQPNSPTSEDFKIAQDSTSCHGSDREETDTNKIENNQSTCNLSDIEKNEALNDDTMKENIKKSQEIETNFNEPGVTSISIDNNIQIKKKKSKRLKSINANNKKTENIDKTEERSKSFKNTDNSGSDHNKRKQSPETCATNNNETCSKQIGFHQNEKQILEDCGFLDIKIINIESHSISYEESKRNIKEPKFSDSMEVQFEIHSMNKDEHAMDLDTELNSDIKMEISEEAYSDFLTPD